MSRLKGSRSNILARTALGLALAASAVRASPQDQSVDPAELPRIPALEPSEALKSFRVRPGFEIQLVAAEPLVCDPVAMVLDEESRFFVVEMRDYPFEPGKGQSPEQDARRHAGRVRLLEDVDGDARADRSVVYAEGLVWPTGIVCSQGGVYVAAAPDILYLKDTDADGVADRREVVYSGFGTQNVQALLNSLRWGLDNHIWGASGGNGGDVRGRGAPVSLRGRDFRFAPRERADLHGALEAVTGGGQFGMCFDDWGERFVCNNSNHIRWVALESRYLARNPGLTGAHALVDIAEDGAAAPVHRLSTPEPWRLVRTRWRAASADRARYAPTELVPVGFFTSATGIHVYRGDAFPRAYRGSVFVGDVGGNLVHHKTLEPRGTGLAARRPDPSEQDEFLASSDNWFRPVGFAEGPDGALYVLDMYRETIEHPASIPESIKSHLDLKSGDDRGRIYRIVPRDFPRQPRARLGSSTAAGLVATLDHPAAWWRETAQRLLIERQATGVEQELRSLAREGLNPLARAHALWTLHGLGLLRATDTAIAAGDRDARVRKHALDLAERLLLAGKGQDDEGLAELLCAGARDVDPGVRRQAALSLGALSSRAATEALALLATTDAGDEGIREAILCSSRRREPGLLVGALSRSSGGSPALESFVEQLARGLGAGDVAAAGAALEALGLAPSRSVRLERALLLGLGEGLQLRGVNLAALLDGGPEPFRQKSARIRELLDEARGLAAEAQAALEDRGAAIRLLGCDRPENVASAVAKLLDPGESLKLQLIALGALGQLHDQGVAPLLIARWRTFGPSLRREGVDVLLGREERIPALLGALEEGVISAGDLDPLARKRLLERAPEPERDRAVRLLGREVRTERSGVVDAFRPALALEGNVPRGLLVFQRLCAPCHRLGAVGASVAPDLATVRDRSPEALLIQVLDPNREVAPVYMAYEATTSDGRALTGILAAETDTSVTLRRAEGAEDTVLRSQIVRLEATGLSLMPEGLEKGLSAQDVSDLLRALREGPLR